MNYRHAYHAGNFADVLKHGVLCWIVRYLQQKEAPLCLIDTHAGAGVYDLLSPQAQKTQEAAQGILKLIGRSDLPLTLVPLIEQVKAANEASQIRLYPGSPMLLARLARRKESSSDRVVVCELHPDELDLLKSSVSPASALTVISGDGYKALSRLVPPPEKRGLVLIDPPFEVDDEFERLAGSFVSAYRKWPTGVFILWFPMKDGARIKRFTGELVGAGVRKLTMATLDVAAGQGLSSTGLLLCNAPFNFSEEWAATVPWLAQVLGRGPGARGEVVKLIGD